MGSRDFRVAQSDLSLFSQIVESGAVLGEAFFHHPGPHQIGQAVIDARGADFDSKGVPGS